MTALLTTGNWDDEIWIDQLAGRLPCPLAVLGRDDYDPAAIRYALTWKPPEGLLPSLPNLEVIFNLGAGVDAVLSDPDIPDLPLVRLVDENLTYRMGEWVLLQTLTHHRLAGTYRAQQERHEWRPHEDPIASELTVGLMGYGVLAQHAAQLLVAVGYEVQAWSRSEKAADVTLFVGEVGMEAFLASTDILVVLLPLTAETRGILNKELFGKLKKDGVIGGPVLINGGRGGLQNEADILAALKNGTLVGASLDVFCEEPLPADSPMWDAPNLVITPHVAAVSDPRTVSRYVAEQITAYERGEPLSNIVDRDRGY